MNSSNGFIWANLQEVFVDVTPHCSVLVCEWLLICMFNESEVINVNEDSVLLLCSSKGKCQNISLFEPEQSLSLSQDEGEWC